MSKLLYIAASPRGEASESVWRHRPGLPRHLSRRPPDVTVDTLDLRAEPLPPYARHGANAKMTVFGGNTPDGVEADAWAAVGWSIRAHGG